MDRHGQRLGGGGSRIAGEALIPRETVMGSLCSSDDGCVGGSGVSDGWCLTPRQGDQPRPHHLHPSAPKGTTWPITPKDRKTRDRRKHRWRGIRQKRNWGRRRWSGCDRPENGADPSWLEGGRAFLTVGTQLAGAAIADAGCIQQPIRAIVLRSALLWVEGVIGGTAQGSVGLEGKRGSWKSPGKRRARPLRWSIHHGWRWLADRRWRPRVAQRDRAQKQVLPGSMKGGALWRWSSSAWPSS